MSIEILKKIIGAEACDKFMGEIEATKKAWDELRISNQEEHAEILNLLSEINEKLDELIEK